MDAPKLQGRIIAGIILILVGAFFFLDNYDLIYIPSEFIRWQYFMIIVGLLFLGLAQNKTAGFILVAIGLFGLYPGIWPLIFVLIGVKIIWGRRISGFRMRHSSDIPDTNESNYIDQINLFGGGKKFLTTDQFKGGSIISIFGGSEVNMQNCQLASGNNTLEVTSIFGGSTLIIPSDWQIEVDVLPLFGGFSDKRIKDPNAKFIGDKKLIIKGVALFGGGEIKTSF
jgi:predicted membrane protein